MKTFLIAAAAVIAGASALAAPASAADVGLSLSIGQPGFYGQIDIGDYPHPQVIYQQPMLIEGGTDDRPPIYLRVPPGHARHWRQHCGEYNACGQRVMFVQNRWYNNEYAPHYREQHRDREERRGEDHGSNDHVNNDHGDRGEHDHGDNHGHGNNH